MRQKFFALLLLAAFSCKKAEYAMPLEAKQASVATDSAARAAVGSPPPPVPQAPALPRMIIRTAEVSLIVGDATASVDKLGALAAANGGYVTDSKVWRDGEVVRATLTLRVPAQKLDAALAAIRKVASRVESETVSGD